MRSLTMILASLAMVVVLQSCSKRSNTETFPELSVGGIYSVDSQDEFTVDGKAYQYKLVKILAIEGDTICWREFSNRFSERPETPPSPLDYSGEEIAGFGVISPFFSGGYGELTGFKDYYQGRTLKFFLQDAISAYDQEAIKKLKS